MITWALVYVVKLIKPSEVQPVIFLLSAMFDCVITGLIAFAFVGRVIMIFIIIGIAGYTLCIVFDQLLRHRNFLLIGRICHFWKYRVSKLRSWLRERKTQPHDDGKLIEFANKPIDRRERLRDW